MSRHGRSPAGETMVPMDIIHAVYDGETARVLAWLDADVSEPRDVNDVEEETGHTLLMRPRLIFPLWHT